MWLTSEIIIFTFFVYNSLVNANHISPCGKTDLSDRDGTIKSPNYPKPFPSQVQCEWTIKSPKRSSLTLQILDLDLDRNCSQHWLSVPLEGGRGSVVLCRRRIPPEAITSFKQFTTVKYYSSEVKKESRGFTLHYKIDSIPCGFNDIQCPSGGCVSNISRCDGVKDCEDGSDEVGCPLKTTWCAEGASPCPSSPKHCFSLTDQTCDGEFFCPRGEDELSCAPGCPNQIACSSGDGCYDPTQRCNGVRNCRDNSDETDCMDTNCGPLEFICRNGGCVAAASLCDGLDDCGDMSDEQHCAKSSLLAAATLGLLACVFLSCIGLSCLYRFYTARLRASTAFLQQLEPESLDDGFVYREPPPSYAVALADPNPSTLVLEMEPPPRRQRRRQRRRNRFLGDARSAVLSLAKQRVMAPIELVGRVECQWRAQPSSPSRSPSRESVTSSTSVEDLLMH